jgi:hypothetical protein
MAWQAASQGSLRIFLLSTSRLGTFRGVRAGCQKLARLAWRLTAAVEKIFSADPST